MNTLFELIPYLIAVLFGIIIGSFLNVCIYRIPLRESVVVTRSHCMSCGYHLRWYDLVPVLSYVFLKGRCRKCGEKISVQYPLIEGTNGILYLLVFLVNGWNPTSVLYCLMASALLSLSMIDWQIYEIPPCFNIFLGCLGIVQIILDLSHWYEYLIGGVCVSFVLLLIYFISNGRAIGGGDVKLMAACGLLLGWKSILLAFFLGCIIGSVVHIIRMRISHAGHVLAMGPYLAAGIFLAALWGRQWIDIYMSTL